MDGYTSSTYGDAFADVYDDWYADLGDVPAIVDLVAALAEAHPSLPVLELGVGTGRLAIPLAARGLSVVGIDASAAMLAKLAANDPRQTVCAHLGDMVEELPDGPFSVVFAAFNTFFNVLTESRQHACFTAVAALLPAGGVFLIDAFVPEPRSGSTVSVRSMTTDSVVLSVVAHDEQTRVAQGQYISISEEGGVRLRPWAIRYATVAQLDAMATAAGFVLAERFADPQRSPFDVESSRHVSIYRTNHIPVPPPHDVKS
ncbi:MAG TPA: class I SAM-dependent methyltransferase [Ilumatobacteraceae bacterium]